MASSHLIDIYMRSAQGPGGKLLILNNVSRDKFEFYSNEARRLLASNPLANEAHREIIIPVGVPAALSKVISIISQHKGKRTFYIGGLKSMSNAQRCYIWQACDILDLSHQDSWDRVTGDLKYRLSHHNNTPETMRAVSQVFSKHKDDPVKRQVWKTFVNQYVWDTLQKRYKPEVQEQLDLELLKHPVLQQAIVAREEELRPKIMKHHEHMRENAERHQENVERNRATKYARKEKKYQEDQEKLRRKHAGQVLDGKREYYAELDPYLQQLKAERKAASA